jgi:soluble lytic murein transglycosylase-like protein
MVLPVLAATIGATAVVTGVEGTTYMRAAAGVLDRALQPSAAIRRADSAAPSPPVSISPQIDSTTIRDTATGEKPASSRAMLDVDSVRHPLVQEWMRRLTTSSRGDYQTSLARMEEYEDMISSKLAERDMPQELIYLAMIESNFNPNAKSPAKAVGLWQFMSATARRFGLTVGGRVDERRDPSRATDAALKYLSSLYDRFGSWYLAAAAYNSGEGTIQRALRRVTGKRMGTDADFFRILPTLPRETQNYVPKLIASARVGQAPERYGFQPAANVLTRQPVTPRPMLGARQPSNHAGVVTRATESKRAVAKPSVAKAPKTIAKANAVRRPAPRATHHSTTAKSR